MSEFQSQFNRPFLEWRKDFSNINKKMKSPPLLKRQNHDMHNNAELLDSVLFVPGSRLVTDCFISKENVVKFVNAGGGAIMGDGGLGVLVMPDNGFEGGNVLRTNETVVDDGHFGVLYQSARIGNFCYKFDSLPAGDYLVDLHFAEIINTNGPKGMRVFNVFIQEEKVVSELDIYSIVGANRPLKVEDIRVTVGDNAKMVIRFSELNGSPIVNGICIKEAPESQAKQWYPETESFIYENQYVRARCNAMYEKKIEELQLHCQQKTDECYQAWMSLTDMNKKLEEVRMELDNKCFQNHCLDQSMVLQARKLKDISSKYEHDKRLWVETLNNLKLKVENMKDEQSKLSHEAHDCANSIPDLNKMVSAVQGLVAQCEDFKLKYSEEQAERRKLHNQIQETKGNIRVFCRCRPLSREENLAGYTAVVDFDTAKDGDLGIRTSGSAKKVYRFDCVYTPKDDQVDVFVDASPLVTSVLDGYNVCIFAYGQTGTGKTFTMEGTEHNRGVNYRTLELLFQIIEERKETFVYNLSVNVIEVYNEQIRDLLATSPASKKLEIRQVSEGINHVPGIVNAEVENVREVWKVLQAGSNSRAVGSNNVNEHSSRSHCMICLTVRAKNLVNGECTKSKLWLVDLAGSERLAKTDIQGERLKEAQNINRSLSALGDVVSALAAKSSHIPYRNSKLTHLLQDSLGGDSKTLMFVQISPLEQDLSETLSSLNFATRVKGIELGPAKKHIDMSELQKLKLQLDRTKQEHRSKDDSLQKLEEIYRNLESKAKGKEQLCRNQQEKIIQVESQLELKTELCKHLEKQLSRLSVQVQAGEDIHMNLQQKVDELERKLKDCDLVESNTLQHKVKELEKALKERTDEFEVQSASLRKKIIELQQKSSERDNELEILPQLSPSGMLRASLNRRRASSTPETEVGTDPRAQTVKSRHRLAGKDSIMLKGSESLSQLRKKGDLLNRGIENNILLENPLIDKKVALTIESNKIRHIDPSKAFARGIRTTKPVSGAQRFSTNRINREPVTKSKESDTSIRVWLR